jgi:hypothetical protein
MTNELTIVDQPRISLVDIRRNPQQFPRLHSYTQDTAIRMMGVCVLRAAKYFDVELSLEDVNQTACDLYTELMDDVEGLNTYNITFEEILRAIRKAAAGQSVEFFGKVSFHFLYKAIMHYVKSEVLEANRQMIQQAERERGIRYAEKTALITGSGARQLANPNKV